MKIFWTWSLKSNQFSGNFQTVVHGELLRNRLTRIVCWTVQHYFTCFSPNITNEMSCKQFQIPVNFWQKVVLVVFWVCCLKQNPITRSLTLQSRNWFSCCPGCQLSNRATWQRWGDLPPPASKTYLVTFEPIWLLKKKHSFELTLILWNSLIYTILKQQKWRHKPGQILYGEYEPQASLTSFAWFQIV